mgnify:CR=1 FL=1
MSTPLPRIVISVGEPAGIGPDIVIACAQRAWPAELVVVGDRAVLAQRAQQLKLPLRLTPYSSGHAAKLHSPGTLFCVHIPTRSHVTPGQLDVANGPYVVASLNQCAELCRSGEADALVTAPIQKSIINEAGIPFSGHTEYLAELTNTKTVVMLLATPTMRVALATTHVPLSQVPKAITRDRLTDVITVLDTDLRTTFGLTAPNIVVLGLNPHAGEAGNLGTEEIDTIIPVIDEMNGRGFTLTGPLPADTAFNTSNLENADAFLAMYHDQGLPVLKYAGFGEAVNITLGLPIIRTSVDHGTALNIAGTGKASASSLVSALTSAIELSIAKKTYQT